MPQAVESHFGPGDEIPRRVVTHFGPGDMDDMPPMTENITVLNCNNSSSISMQVSVVLGLHCGYTSWVWQNSKV